MEDKVALPEVRETCDLDYYIKTVGEAEKRSSALWRSIYKHILTILEEAKKKKTPLMDIADRLSEREAGPWLKGEPACIEAYRTVARAMMTRQKVSLL